MVAHMQTLVAIAMAGINRSLPCQAAIAQNEETRFVYDIDLQPTIKDLLEEGVRVCKSEFPIQALLDTIGMIGGHISAMELSSIVDILAIFLSAGRVLPAELIAFVVSKLEFCDFTIPPSPVFFVRILIRDRHSSITEHIPRITQFFAEKLTAPVSTARYYWETVTNIISAVFDTAFSAGIDFDLASFIGPILARLPVRGDLSEASYIYEVILSLAAAPPSCGATVHSARRDTRITEQLV
jgi:hypothetical protein